MAPQTKSKAQKESLVKWAKSKDTKQAIKEAFDRSQKSILKLREARRIDTETLNKPITM
jgi:hypothetical protein